MATLYGTKRYNGAKTCWWRLRVDYSGTSATAYVDVGPSGWSIWLRFTTGTNTFTKSANTYYAKNNGGSSNKLGTTTISETSSTTITQTCSGSDWGGDVNKSSSVTIPAQKASFNLNILLPNGDEPYDTGAAGSVERSINGGSYARKYNEEASTYAIGTTFAYRNFTPGTGLHLASVSGVSPTNTTGPWSLTLNSGTTVTFKTAWNTYTVTYNANGGSGAPGNQTKTHGVNLTLSSTKPTKSSTTSTGYTVTFDGNGGTPSKTSAVATNTTSYTFNHWDTASDGSGTDYASGGSYTTEASDTLYAIYSSSLSRGAITTATASKSNGTSTRKVTFNATTNGGSCSTASLNSTATITYSCNGWYTAASGGTKRASSGGSYTPSSSETVYAQWGSSTGTYSAITLPAATKSNGTATRTVTFNGNGGSTPSAMASTATITYTQTGWYTAASGGTSRGKAGASYTPSAAETVYAQFSSSTGSYSAITLPTPTRTDYIFKGWATSASATEGVTGSYTPTGNVTLYATWVEDQAKARIKQNNTWKQGKVFIKKNGTWVKAKKIYKKVNGHWQIGKNS